MIHVVAEGPADAPVVVFAHALGTDHTLWDPQARHFRERWRVVRYDARGHGLSDAPGGREWSLPMLAADLIEVIDRVGAERVHFVGLSIGGVVGAFAAAAAPERFRSLMVCAARLHASEAFAADLARRADEIERTGLAPVAARMVDRWLPAGSDPALRERVLRQLLATSPTAYAATARGVAHYDLRAAVGRLAMPVTLVAGALDEDIPAGFAALAHDHPHLDVITMPHTGHLPNLERPEAFDAQLEAALMKSA